jgi:hypothetical protein
MELTPHGSSSIAPRVFLVLLGSGPTHQHTQRVVGLVQKNRGSPGAMSAQTRMKKIKR